MRFTVQYGDLLMSGSLETNFWGTRMIKFEKNYNIFIIVTKIKIYDQNIFNWF